MEYWVGSPTHHSSTPILHHSMSSLSHFIRPRQQLVRNCKTDLFCRRKANDEFNVHRLLYG